MYTLHYTYEASGKIRGAIARLRGIRKYGWPGVHNAPIGACYCHHARWYNCPSVTKQDIEHFRKLGVFVPAYI